MIASTEAWKLVTSDAMLMSRPQLSPALQLSSSPATPRRACLAAEPRNAGNFSRNEPSVDLLTLGVESATSKLCFVRTKNSQSRLTNISIYACIQLYSSANK